MDFSATQRAFLLMLEQKLQEAELAEGVTAPERNWFHILAQANTAANIVVKFLSDNFFAFPFNLILVILFLTFF